MLEFPLHSGPHQMPGPAGNMDILIDAPSQYPVGMVIVAHPQPLLGGNANHKIPHLLARALCDEGWLAVRPNFRGAGLSEGQHDAGVGEANDVLYLIQHLLESTRGYPLALVGFSFGAFVLARAARKLAERGAPAAHVVLMGLPTGNVQGNRTYTLEGPVPNALIVHGEYDDRVSLASIFEWARPHSQPVVVVPGADHFFTGKLATLRALVVTHLNQRST